MDTTASTASDPLLSTPTPPLPILRRKLPLTSYNISSITIPSSPLCPLPEDGELTLPPFSPSSPSPSPSSFKERIIFGPSLPPAATVTSVVDLESATADSDLLWLSSPSCKHKSNLHRSATAPAISPVDDGGGHDLNSKSNSRSPEGPSVIRSSCLLLFGYLAFGVVVYAVCPSSFSGPATHPVVDAFYFCIVTMCTIGYGDITPATPLAKLFSITFVIVGFGFVDILLSVMVGYVLDLQEPGERQLSDRCQEGPRPDPDQGRAGARRRRALRRRRRRRAPLRRAPRLARRVLPGRHVGHHRRIRRPRVYDAARPAFRVDLVARVHARRRPCLPLPRGGADRQAPPHDRQVGALQGHDRRRIPRRRYRPQRLRHGVKCRDLEN